MTALVFSRYDAQHETGSHPENQSRLDAVKDRLGHEGLLEGRPVFYAETIDPETLRTVHDGFLIDQVRDLSARGGGMIDGDTLVAPGSWLAARAAAGAAVEAVDLVLSGDYKRAFSLTRPPGHHAERRRQLGFCLFNNIAIAAQHATSEYGLQRIAIVDWDVHHGNGTQDIFYETDSVLFCSIHQWPLFPGTGLQNETGSGNGEGYTLNIPLPAGAGDAEYLSVMDDVVGPVISAFRPELLMVSAGFDAHRDDPLAMMAVSEHGFRRLTERVLQWAEELTDGQLVLMLEGGYNLRALSESVVSTLNALDSFAPEVRD